MRISEKNRDNLIQRSSWLIQSGHFKENIDKLNNEITGIDFIIDFDYMGSSEFEDGSLYRSLRRMTLNKDFYKVITFENYKDKNGNSLKIYAPEINLKSIKENVDRLIIGSSRLKEYCSLHRHLEKEESWFKCEDNRNFWWDIDNDFFIFFEHEEQIQKAMDALSKRKFGYEENVPQEAFSKFYKEMVLPRFNEHRFNNFKTTIKDYFYDETTETHFVEFIKDSTIEAILMEAMLMSKVDKGEVKFSINEIPFCITEEKTLEDIIIEYNINPKDTCISSNTIKELLKKEQERKQKQQELINVLKKVRDKKANQ